MSSGPLPEFVRVRAHGMHWWVARDFAEVLPRLDLEAARGAVAGGPSELVKDSAARTLVRLPHPDRPDGPGLYVKRFRFGTLARKLRHVARPTPARREWMASRRLLRRAVPACRVVAIAGCRSGLLPADAFLISEEIPDAVSLSDYMASEGLTAGAPLLKRQLIEEIADLVAGIIRAGVRHDDLHVGNILIAPSRPAGQRLFVVDLHSAGPLWRGRVRRMLMCLADSTAGLEITSADRVRFLRALLARWKGKEPVPEALLRRWAERVRATWQRHERSHLRSRTRRCVAGHKGFARGRAGGFLILRRQDFPASAALAAVDQHRKAALGQHSRALLHKAGPRTQISHLPDDSGSGAVYVKAFVRAGLGERIKDLLRWTGRARAAWVAHWAFELRGLPAPAGLALLEAESKLSGCPDYLITEAVGAEGDLHQVTHSQPPGAPAPPPPLPTVADRRQLAAAVADLFRLLAARRVRHPDMKPSNILVARAGAGLRLLLVDLSRVRFGVAWRRGHWVHHLAQCNAGLGRRVSVLDRMRCLRRCGQGRWTAQERLRVARAVFQASLTRNPAWR